MGVEVFQGQNLRASGAHLTVQLGRRVGPRGRPLIGLVLLVFVSPTDVRLLLWFSEVPVGCEKLLLLVNVWQQHQQLVEDEVKVVSEQLLAAVVVLGCRYCALAGGGGERMEENSSSCKWRDAAK